MSPKTDQLHGLIREQLVEIAQTQRLRCSHHEASYAGALRTLMEDGGHDDLARELAGELAQRVDIKAHVEAGVSP